MGPYLAVLLLGFVVALVASAGLSRALRRPPVWLPLGGLQADERHAGQVGGIAVLFAFVVAPFLATLVSDKAAEYFNPKRMEFLGYTAAAALVFVTGLVDDWRTVQPWQKISGQVLAGAAVYAAGYRLDDIEFPWGGGLSLGLLGLPCTLLWVVLFTNAVNLIDGKDGLATGVSVFAAAALAVVAANTNHPAVALLFAGLAGAGLGFLPFNLPKASLILGDNGSLLFGFVLSTLAIRGATGPEDEVFIGVPLLALGFPVLDTLLSATRRLLDGRHPFAGDRDHIHHRVSALNLSALRSLAVLYAIALIFAASAVATHLLSSLLLEGAVFSALSLFIVLVLGRLGYVGTLWNSRGLMRLRGRASY